MELAYLQNLARLVRYFILKSTTAAGSGHPTSSLSAVELMVGLMFGGVFRFDFDNPDNPANDRLIFSKGHASPLFYSLYAAAGKVSEEELMTLRKFGSRLEGHPMPSFPYTEAATGSLGQGLSIGAGMALVAKRFTHPVPTRRDTPPQEGTSIDSPLERGSRSDGRPVDAQGSEEGCVSLPRVYVLLGDSEMAEGSVWEAIQWAAYEKLNNLVGIIDVNRLGQSGATMLGHDVEGYAQRVRAFGWGSLVIDGHDLNEVIEALRHAVETREKPTMIIAKTVKGKGVSFLEDKEGWHGRALSQAELESALRELGEVDTSLRGVVEKPVAQVRSSKFPPKADPPLADKVQNDAQRHPGAELSGAIGSQGDSIASLQNDRLTFVVSNYKNGELVATRKAYGAALAKLALSDARVVVLDAEVKNSTFAETVLKQIPSQYVEMFIAEQNMVGVAVGLARRGKIPFCSTFAAFFTRAFDQIRMGAYSFANIKFCGSHAGVSIGEDGPSQMGLEDLALFRSLQGPVVLYPSDAVSAEKLVMEAYRHKGMVYIRTTRGVTPVIYEYSEKFPIGGIKLVRSSKSDTCTIVAAGITLHEALKAYEAFTQEGIEVRIVDLYSVKPLDRESLRRHAQETGCVVTVEDHGPEGGIGEAVAAALAGLPVKFASLAVRKIPRSGKPEELMRFEEIDAKAIVDKVKELHKV